MFVEGLLADIGHLVMFQADPDNAEIARDTAIPRAYRSRGRSRHRRLQLRRSRRRPGGRLASAQRLRDRHRRPVDAGVGGHHVTEAALLHLANQISPPIKSSKPTKAVLERMDPMTVPRYSR